MEWLKLNIRLSDRKTYRVNIKLIYKGTGLLKFEITGGSKKVVLEKHLYRKSNKWMMPVGGLCEADVRIFASCIDFLIENPTGVRPKYVHPKNADLPKKNSPPRLY